MDAFLSHLDAVFLIKTRNWEYRHGFSNKDSVGWKTLQEGVVCQQGLAAAAAYDN
jgi:hypothetical protein